MRTTLKFRIMFCKIKSHQEVGETWGELPAHPRLERDEVDHSLQWGIS